MKLLMLKGLPASGKSTYAKELVAQGGWTRVNKDSLRSMLHNGKWSRKNEEEVILARNALIFSALSSGKNVVVDDTNFNPRHQQEFEKMCELCSNGRYFEFEVLHVATDVEECIKRDLKRGAEAVGEQVIRRMWRQYVAPVQEREIDYALDDAVIFDVDGTLARMDGRSPYDWKRVGEDKPNLQVIHLLDLFRNSDKRILIFSGRDGSCFQETTDWLRKWEIFYDELHMRPEGDTRKDVAIKEEFYDNCRKRFNIEYVVDDRPSVCRMWHTKGICLLKVGDPDLEF